MLNVELSCTTTTPPEPPIALLYVNVQLLRVNEELSNAAVTPPETFALLDVNALLLIRVLPGYHDTTMLCTIRCAVTVVHSD